MKLDFLQRYIGCAACQEKGKKDPCYASGGGILCYGCGSAKGPFGLRTPCKCS